MIRMAHTAGTPADPADMRKLTRRIGATLLAAASLLTACSDDDTSEAEPTTTTAAEPGLGANTGTIDLANQWPEDRLCGLLTTEEAAEVLDQNVARVHYDAPLSEFNATCTYSGSDGAEIWIDAMAFSWDEQGAAAEYTEPGSWEPEERAGLQVDITPADEEFGLDPFAVVATDDPRITLQLNASSEDELTALIERISPRL